MFDASGQYVSIFISTLSYNSLIAAQQPRRMYRHIGRRSILHFSSSKSLRYMKPSRARWHQSMCFIIVYFSTGKMFFYCRKYNDIHLKTHVPVMRGFEVFKHIFLDAIFRKHYFKELSHVSLKMLSHPQVMDKTNIYMFFYRHIYEYLFPN